MKDERYALMQEAMNDEMFVADLKEVMDDFKHADFEEVEGINETEASSEVQREAALRLRAIRDRMPVLDVSIKDLIEEGRYR